MPIFLSPPPRVFLMKPGRIAAWRDQYAKSGNDQVRGRATFSSMFPIINGTLCCSARGRGRGRGARGVPGVLPDPASPAWPPAEGAAEGPAAPVAGFDAAPVAGPDPPTATPPALAVAAREPVPATAVPVPDGPTVAAD